MTNILIILFIILYLFGIFVIYQYELQQRGFWKWMNGKQDGCEYRKVCLWSFKIWKWGFDAYILKYQPKASLPIHTDPVKDGKHWRLNIKIRGLSYFSYVKGERWITTQNRFIIFRPDIQRHTLLVANNICVKLSFGFVKFKL